MKFEDIQDVGALKRAIRSAVNAGERAGIALRAVALEQDALLPATWNADGTLSNSDRALPAPFAKRERMTYNDVETALEAAISDSLTSSKGWGADPDDEYVYIVDMNDEWCVYEIGWDGDYIQVSYTIDDSGKITLGTPTKVNRVTTYEPAPRSASDPKEERLTIPASAKKGFASLREWCPPALGAMQVRMSEDTQLADFLGYPSRTEVGYDVVDWLGSYRETINCGAFAKTLRETENVPLLLNHEGMPIASTRAKTSRLSEDGEGLLNEATLDRRQALTNDICIALERGDLSQMSFSFAAVRQSWSKDYNDRSVSELRLYDTSIVTYPASPTTTAGLRSEMRESMGREGVGTMWALRGALAELREKRELPTEAEPVVESALRALRAADDALATRFGGQGRARTYIVAGIMDSLLTEVRQGKVLSAANEALLRSALDALHEADESLTSVDSALDAGQAAISATLQTANPDDDEPDAGNAADSKSSGATNNKTGVDNGGNGTGQGGGGNPINPNDGAGSRAAMPRSVAETYAMLRKLGR